VKPTSKLTGCSRMIEKLAISQLVKKSRRISRNPTIHHCNKKTPMIPSSSKIIPDDTRPPTSTCIPVLVSYLGLGHTGCKIPPEFHTVFPPNACHLSCLSHSPLLVTNSSNIMKFDTVQFFYSLLFRPQPWFQIFAVSFSRTCSCPSMRDQVLHPHKNEAKLWFLF